MRIEWLAMGMLVAGLLGGSVHGQTPAAADAPRGTSDGGWRATATEGNSARAAEPATRRAAVVDPVAPGSTPAATMPSPAGQPAPVASPEPRRSITQVSSGSGTLPNDCGQLWREYDISPYTLRVTSTSRPEQAIVDWILRETGYEAWHTEPLAILSATSRKLLVYHTPEMQAVVAEIVDRFVSSEAETHAFALRVITVDNPNWRARAQGLLQPVQVQTPGVQAWLVARETAAVLLAELRRRTDFREHSSPQLQVNNGQSTIVSATRAKGYVRNVIPRADVWPGFEPEVGQIDEGYALEFSPLLSVDGRMIDATIKCNVDQVEKLVPVVLDVASSAASRQRTKIEVPQVTSFRFHERFRWPVDKVLLVSMGVVPLPVPSDGRSVVPGIPLPLPTGPARADLLVFVESKGATGQAARVTRVDSPATTLRGNN
ncbi:MAG: hypothetical protein ABFD16_15815 [Thermoguttaceae bacterium]|jgi:hypothetical protein